ncbi:hypothetical protein K466DRAFT_283333 [Polyporus arcularius HHB13444]|uniref:Uncharacterized protein n=1 Tax=Polyporus arcularius HHB13444 TaxID=1314778 RepID=A0A5C3Q0B4_9APHY|nr:hypothetical protein K466DRAFT_283333 [Polyporus arcularius HHB13444]
MPHPEFGKTWLRPAYIRCPVDSATLDPAATFAIPPPTCSTPSRRYIFTHHPWTRTAAWQLGRDPRQRTAYPSGLSPFGNGSRQRRGRGGSWPPTSSWPSSGHSTLGPDKTPRRTTSMRSSERPGLRRSGCGSGSSGSEAMRGGSLATRTSRPSRQSPGGLHPKRGR